MKCRFILNCSCAFALTSLFFGATASAAYLKFLGGTETRNGVTRPIWAAKIQPSGEIEASTSANLSISVWEPGSQDGSSGDTELASSERFLVEPDAGEQVGDCVLLNYTYEGSASAVLTSGTAAAEAASGGLGPMASASYDVRRDQVEAAASVSEPTLIILDPDGTATRLFSGGPITVQVNDPPVALEESNSIKLVIGDTIDLLTASAVALAALPEAVAESEASAILRVSLSPCPLLKDGFEEG